jgi:hypothetical protein
MVDGAQRQHVRQIGEAEGLPRDDVVNLAVVERHVAVRMSTRAVHRPKEPPLLAVGRADRAAGVDRLAVGPDRDRHDLGIATQPAHRGERQRCAVGEFAHRVLVHPTEQGGVIDVHTHLGNPWGVGGSRRRRDHLDQRRDGEALQRHRGVAVALANRRELGVDGAPQLGARLGIDFGEQLPHPGGLVDPPGHTAVALLAVQFTGAVVGCHQPGKVADVLLERGDRCVLRRFEQVVGEPVERRPSGVVEPA